MLDQIIQLFIGHHLNAWLKSYFTLFIVTCKCLSGHYQMETFLCHLKPFNNLKTKSPIISVCRRKGMNYEELQKATESTSVLTQAACFPVPQRCHPWRAGPTWMDVCLVAQRMFEQQLQRACSDLKFSRRCPLNCRVSARGSSGGTLATGKRPLFLALSSRIHSHSGWC